jgi:hypothetical protein
MGLARYLFALHFISPTDIFNTCMQKLSGILRPMVSLEEDFLNALLLADIQGRQYKLKASERPFSETIFPRIVAG